MKLTKSKHAGWFNIIKLSFDTSKSYNGIEVLFVFIIMTIVSLINLSIWLALLFLVCRIIKWGIGI
jgi:hypothetical protein